MQRFVWDLHYPPPEGSRPKYPISAIYHDTPPLPMGPAVRPGQYTVKLTVGGRTYTQHIRPVNSVRGSRLSSRFGQPLPTAQCVRGQARLFSSAVASTRSGVVKPSVNVP